MEHQPPGDGGSCRLPGFYGRRVAQSGDMTVEKFSDEWWIRNGEMRKGRVESERR